MDRILNVTLKVLLWGVVAWFFGALGCAVIFGQELCYVRQDGTTQHVEPLRAGHVGSLGGAHDPCVVGLDGACYAIASECTPSHTENSYPRPGPNAGALVDTTWEYFHTDPEANLHRCNVALVVGRDLNPAWNDGTWPPPRPANGWPACKPITGHPDWMVSKVGCVPFTVAPGTFNPRIFACDGTTPTPGPPSTRTKTPTARPGTPTRTPTKTPTPSGLCCPPGQVCPKGVPPCVTPVATPTIPSPTRPPLTPTKSPTATPAPATPVPGRTVVPIPPPDQTPRVVPPRPTAVPPPTTPTLAVIPSASGSPPTSGGSSGSKALLWLLLVAVAGAVASFVRAKLIAGQK